LLLNRTEFHSYGAAKQRITAKNRHKVRNSSMHIGGNRYSWTSRPVPHFQRPPINFVN